MGFGHGDVCFIICVRYSYHIIYFTISYIMMFLSRVIPFFMKKYIYLYFTMTFENVNIKAPIAQW